MTIQPSSTCFVGVQFFHPLSDCDRLDWPFQLDFPLFCWLLATFNQWWFFTHKFDGWLWWTTTFFFPNSWLWWFFMNLTPTNPPAFLSSARFCTSSWIVAEGAWAFRMLLKAVSIRPRPLGLRSEVSDQSEVPNFPGFQWDQAWELPTSNGLSLVDQ